MLIKLKVEGVSSNVSIFLTKKYQPKHAILSVMSITESHKAIFYRLSLLGQVTLHELIYGSCRNLFIIANLQF